MPTVSIIIPNYNHSLFLKERLDSVFGQSHQDFEVIILDDASTDNSKDIIESYRNHHKVSHIIYNEENSGSTFKQWKKGIDLAKGEWIWMAESDDISAPDFLENLLTDTQKNPDIVLCYCASYRTNESSETIGILDWAYNLDNTNWENSYTNSGTDEIQNKLFYKNTIPNASAVIFKKKALSKDIFKTISQMKFAGDWLFWVKILENGSISFNPQKMNFFRIHSASTRVKKTASLEIIRFKEYFRILNYISAGFSVTWKYKFHSWIMTEFFSKLNLLNSFHQFGLIKQIPWPYKLSFLKKSIQKKKQKK